MTEAKKATTTTNQENHAGSPAADGATATPLENHAGSEPKVIKPAENHAGSETA
ncbi:hypothetical protein [Streptomyces sp. NBC_00344]|uniref:hypothetical protein n=1 Tax=Streptomyces sp. NBC_00344 TaxID=2975720 RepID=UPI002E1C7412